MIHKLRLPVLVVLELLGRIACATSSSNGKSGISFSGQQYTDN